MTDMSYSQAAAEVRRLIKTVKAVDLIGEALDKMAGLEGAEKEGASALAARRAELETAETNLKLISNEGERIRKEANAERDKLKDEAANLVAGAKSEAKAVVARALEREQKVQNDVVAAQTVLAGLRGEIDGARSELVDIQNRLILARERAAEAARGIFAASG